MQYIEGVGLDRLLARLERSGAAAYRGQLSDIARDVLGDENRLYERLAVRPYAPGQEPGGSATARTPPSEGTAAVLEDLLVFYDRLPEQGGGDASYLEKEDGSCVDHRYPGVPLSRTPGRRRYACE